VQLVSRRLRRRQPGDSWCGIVVGQSGTCLRGFAFSPAAYVCGDVSCSSRCDRPTVTRTLLSAGLHLAPSWEEYTNLFTQDDYQRKTCIFRLGTTVNLFITTRTSNLTKSLTFSLDCRNGPGMKILAFGIIVPLVSRFVMGRKVSCISKLFLRLNSVIIIILYQGLGCCVYQLLGTFLVCPGPPLLFGPFRTSFYNCSSSFLCTLSLQFL
jgi:hypothetical protein